MRDTVTSREVHDFRRDTGWSLTDLARIWEPPDPLTATRAVSGAIQKTYPDTWTLTATVACLIKLPSIRAGVVEAGKPLIVDYPKGLFPFDTAIKATSRVQIIASLSSHLPGESFDVISGQADSYSLSRVIPLKLIEGARLNLIMIGDDYIVTDDGDEIVWN